MALLAGLCSPGLAPARVLASPDLVPETAWTAFFRHNAIAADSAGTPYIFSEGGLFRKTGTGWVRNPVYPGAGYDPSVLVDHLHNVHVFYDELTSGGVYLLHHAECDPNLPDGIACPTAEGIVTRPAENPSAPQYGYALHNAAVEDIDGNLHLVYGYNYGYWGLFYTKRSAGVWSTPVRVHPGTPNEGHMLVDYVSLRLDPDGRTLHAAFNNRTASQVPTGLYYATKPAGGNWIVEPVSQGVLISQLSLVQDGNIPRIAYLWPNPSTGQKDLKLATRAAGGGWSHELLYARAGGEWIDADILNGTLHVIAWSPTAYRPLYVTKVLPGGAPEGRLVVDSGFTETPFVSMAASDCAIHVSYGRNRTQLKYLRNDFCNQAPVSSNDAYVVDENGALNVPAPGVLANDSDADGDALSASLVSGVSHGTLTLHSDGSFAYVPSANFHGSDGFTYRASDGSLGSNVATALITVNPVNRPPVVDAGGPYVVAEGGSVSVTASGSDPDGDTPTFAWDLDQDGIFEIPGSSATFSAAGVDGPCSRIISARATDPGGLASTDQATVAVLNVAPTVQAGPDATINEGGAFSGSGSFTDPGADTWAATVDYGDGSGVQALWLVGKAFSLSYGYADDGVYDVTVTISDDDEGVGSDTLSVVVRNVAPTAAFANASGPIAEGQSASLAFSAQLDPSPVDTQAGFVYSYDCTGDGTFEATDRDVPTWECAYPDDGNYVALGGIKDKDGGYTQYAAAVTVHNVLPAVGPITAPLDPIRVATPVAASAAFNDSGVRDTHTAVWDWGDGATGTGTVVESNGSGMASGEHAYSGAGVYTLRLTVTDDDGGVSQSTFQFVVVYDPEGGFVTGGGWIDSPLGAYKPNASLCGRANFGFVSKYQKGAQVPTGVTTFQFAVADFKFHSNTYQWLVVAGARAQCKGAGTVNGRGSYAFILTAIDGDLPGGGGSDKFRIKIWDRNSSDTIVYDNMLGVRDDGEPTTVIRGGSITIHKEK